MRMHPRDFLENDVLSEPGNPIVRSVNMLHKHLKPIVFAIKNNEKKIPVGPEVKGMINELKSANLGYLVDGSRNLVIRPEIIKVLRTFEQPGSSQADSVEIQRKWKELEDAIDDYFEFRMAPGSSDSDRQGLKDAIEELTGDLSSLLQDTFTDYANRVFRELGRFNNLKIKIKKVGRAIEEAERLERVISKITLDQINELARGDLEIRDLLRNNLNKVAGECLEEFSNAGHGLREMMDRWRFDLTEGYKRNELLDRFSAYFLSGGGLSIHVESTILPNECRAVQGVKQRLYVDFVDMEEDSALQSYVRRFISDLHGNPQLDEMREQEQKALMDTPLTDGEGFIEDQNPAFMSALEMLFDAFRDNPALQQLSAVDSYLKLESGVKVDYWLSQISSYLNSRLGRYTMLLEVGNREGASTLAHYKELQLVYEEEIDPVFNGNALVHDIIIQRKQKVSA